MPQKRTEAVQSWPGRPVLLTWMREVHFWLHDHPLGRQRGRVLTVGVDWSLELYCNTEQSVRKPPPRFVLLQHHRSKPPTVTALECSAGSSTPSRTAHSPPSSQMLRAPTAELPIPFTMQNAQGISPLSLYTLE